MKSLPGLRFPGKRCFYSIPALAGRAASSRAVGPPWETVRPRGCACLGSLRCCITGTWAQSCLFGTRAPIPGLPAGAGCAQKPLQSDISCVSGTALLHVFDRTETVFFFVHLTEGELIGESHVFRDGDHLVPGLNELFSGISHSLFPDVGHR